MARSFSVTNLILRVRERAAMTGSTAVSDAEIMRLLSADWAELHGILAVRYPERFATSQDIVALASTNDYALNADFLDLIMVTFNIGSYRYPLRSIPIDELPRYTISTGRAYVYIVLGRNISLYPTPAAGQQYSLLYVSAPADLTLGTQTIDGEAGWEEYLVNMGAGKVLQKLQRDGFQGMFAEAERMRDRIKQEAMERDLLVPRAVRDTQGDGGDRRLRPHPSDWFPPGSGWDDSW